MIRTKLAILFILATIAPRPVVSLPLPVPSDIPPDIPTHLDLHIVNDPELLQSLPSSSSNLSPVDWDRALASLSGHASGEAHNQPYQPPQAIQPSHFQQHTSDHFAAPVVPQSSQSSYARPTTTANTHTQLQSTSYHPNPNPNFTPNIHGFPAPQGPQRAGAGQVVPPNTDFGLRYTQPHQSTSHYAIPIPNFTPNIHVPQGPPQRAGADQVVPPNTDFGLRYTQPQSTSHYAIPIPNFTPNIHVPQGPQRAGADQVVPPNTAHPQSASHYPIPNRNIPPSINVPQRAGVVQQNSPSPPLPHLSAFTFSQPWQPLTLSHHDESSASGSSSHPNINLPQRAGVVQNSPSPPLPHFTFSQPPSQPHASGSSSSRPSWNFEEAAKRADARHATPGSSRSGSESPHKKRRRNNGEGEESCPVPDCKHHFYQLSHLRRHIQDKDAHGGKLTEGEIRDFKKLATANSIKRKAEIKKAKKQKLASTVTGPASGDHDHDASGSESGPPPHKKQRKS